MDWTSVLGKGTQLSFHNMSVTAVEKAHSSIRLTVGSLSLDKAVGA